MQNGLGGKRSSFGRLGSGSGEPPLILKRRQPAQHACSVSILGSLLNYLITIPPLSAPSLHRLPLFSFDCGTWPGDPRPSRPRLSLSLSLSTKDYAARPAKRWARMRGEEDDRERRRRTYKHGEMLELRQLTKIHWGPAHEYNRFQCLDTE